MAGSRRLAGLCRTVAKMAGRPHFEHGDAEKGRLRPLRRPTRRQMDRFGDSWIERSHPWTLVANRRRLETEGQWWRCMTVSESRTLDESCRPGLIRSYLGCTLLDVLPNTCHVPQTDLLLQRQDRFLFGRLLHCVLHSDLVTLFGLCVGCGRVSAISGETLGSCLLIHHREDLMRTEHTASISHHLPVCHVGMMHCQSHLQLESDP